MMDSKEIIKWFIPCFHILRFITKLKDYRLIFLCLFLLFNFGFAAKVNSGLEIDMNNFDETKNVDYYNSIKLNQSDISVMEEKKNYLDVSVGRTFGRPFKKMAQALIPLVFQIGAASTWAVVAALVGIKTLAITLIILKLLLVAGAAKLGVLFGQKQHHQEWKPHWEPPHHPQKEIHLHIHNGHHEEAPYSWNRDGAAPETKNVVIDPYSAGPQTISTPYGNYVRVHPGSAPTAPNKRK